MQTTLLTDQEKHSHGTDDPLSACGHEHAPVRLWQTMLGVVLVLNAFLVEWIFPHSGIVASASAMIGAIILGYPIMVTAIRDLKAGALSINELVAIAVLAAFASGDYKTAGVVAFFMLMGEIIETRTAEGARASIESLIKLTPTKARRITPQGEEEVAAKDLAIGDVIRIRPGDNVAADGTILSGQGSFNQATITGESLPVDKKPGDEVFAGTQNLTGVLEIAALVWAFTRRLDNVISVIIFSCPCAFILATPTAMVAALSAAARLGILIKNVADIELAAKINAFVFDKTGTLTTGVLAVSRLMPLDGVTPAELLKVAASAEKYSNHPTAKALGQLAGEAVVALAEPKDFVETAGRGVKADVAGANVLVGRAQWLKDNGVKEDFMKSVDLNEAEGWSLIFVARDGKCIGWVGLQDQTRSDAKVSLAELKESGVQRIAMISGDRQPVATRVAAEIGCEEAKGDCLPQTKVDFVRGVREKGYRVAVVGDGVNDAPALAAGDIGIAMGAAGSEVAIHSATIALMNNDLRRLPFLVRLSRSTRAVINQNFLVGVFFIMGGLTLASFGYLNPVVAAIMHNLGSFIVVFNSARLVRHGEDLDAYKEMTEAPNRA